MANAKPGGAIVLAPHGPTWAAAFDREASAILEALSDVPVELHHIGSTAIPGIVAKPAELIRAVERRARAGREDSEQAGARDG